MKTKTIISCCAFIICLFLVTNGHAFSDERFTHSTDKGNFGEQITHNEMVKRGYESLPSKYNGNNGIDHVFVKRNSDGSVKEVVLCETKTDSSPYSPDQMSDSRIDEQIEKMRQSRNPKAAETAEILSQNKDKVKKEFWHHDTTTGKTTVHGVDTGGNVQEKARYSTERTQKKIMEARERQKAQAVKQAKIVRYQKYQFKQKLTWFKRQMRMLMY